MRNSVFCFILALISISCEENQDPSMLPEHGNISAKMDGFTWEGSTVASVTGDSLRIHGAGNDKHLEFKIKFEGMGSYELTGKQAVYNGIKWGDIATDFHNIAQGETGAFVITEYNSEARTFKGTFQLRLTAVDGNGEINFTEGKLDGIISVH
jgi:hypothetical protein